MSQANGLPSKYKACVYDKPGEVSTSVVELDMPEPGPGEVLIKLYAPHPADTSLSNTDAAHTPASATQTTAS